jgi:hypothetical protein
METENQVQLQWPKAINLHKNKFLQPPKRARTDEQAAESFTD